MATLVVADDDRAIRKIVSDRLTAAGHSVEVAEDGRAALSLIERLAPDIVLLDMQMPNLDGFGVLEALQKQPARPLVIVITAHGTIEAAVRAMKAGAHDFMQKPFEAVQLEHVIEKALETGRLRRDVGVLRGEAETRHRLVLGGSARMREVVELAERAAASEATVLLGGESGTGKEVVARAIHARSHRADGPFVPVNCAALATELLESELFGHEKGAFTGAMRTKPGRVEMAAGGTLFLDEIGELRPLLQAKLLRVLQEREFERLGSSRTLHADARLVAATNVYLPDMVAAKRFRADLSYRLNVFPIRVPPLRERPEDIPLLVRYFARDFARRMNRRVVAVPAAAMDALARYSWPGNIRELQNLIERAMILSPGDVLQITLSEIEEKNGSVTSPSGQQTLEEAERLHILETLKTSGWVLSGRRGAAARLGINRSTLQFRMKKLGIERPSISNEARA